MHSKHKKPNEKGATKKAKLIGLSVAAVILGVATLFFVDLAIVTRNASLSASSGDYSIRQDLLNGSAKRTNSMELSQSKKLADNPRRKRERERAAGKEKKEPVEREPRDKRALERVTKARENSVSESSKRRKLEAEMRRSEKRRASRERTEARRPKRRE